MFSGQTIYSSFQLSTLYLFTCPIFASFGFFYTDLKKETLMSRPEIYKRSRGSYLSFLLTARRQNVQWKTYVDLSLWELCERPSVLVRSHHGNAEHAIHLRRWIQFVRITCRSPHWALGNGIFSVDRHHSKYYCDGSNDGSEVELELRDVLLPRTALFRIFCTVELFLVPCDCYHPLDCSGWIVRLSAHHHPLSCILSSGDPCRWYCFHFPSRFGEMQSRIVGQDLSFSSHCACCLETLCGKRGAWKETNENASPRRCVSFKLVFWMYYVDNLSFIVATNPIH